MKKLPVHGLVSLLPQDYYAKVEALWQMLADEFGLTGVETTPFPHFSWLIGKDFDWPALEHTLRELARETHPITVNTTGIGIFSGPSPVIFIPLVRTDALNALHRRIWDAIQPIGVQLSRYYAPDYWMPHITLAIHDITPQKIGNVTQKLAFQNFNWEFNVDNIGFIYDGDDETGEVDYQFKFVAE